MNDRVQIGLKLVASHLILPIGLVFISVLINNDVFLILSIIQTILCILFLAGYWEFFGLGFKHVFCALIQILILAILSWKLASGSYQHANIYLVSILAIIQAWLICELINIFIVKYRKDTESIEIEFPFRQGVYLVTDGGNSKTSRLMNYHYYSPLHKRKKTNNSMLFATDIIKVKDDKRGFLPKKNEEYPIFNKKIFSPISGVVVKAENSIPDNEPYSGKYPYNTGNTVVIQKDNYYLLLGHFKQGSIVVKEGDIIRTNDLIGAAGNSGWTERPHLHMQLIKSDSPDYWSGKGISMQFRNRNLYKNRLIKNLVVN